MRGEVVVEALLNDYNLRRFSTVSYRIALPVPALLRSGTFVVVGLMISER